MRTTIIVAATLAVAALPGCHFRAHGSSGHASVSSHVEVELAYTYFPAHHAYWCESTDEWWVIEHGGWTRRRSRPVNIVIHQETTWVVVNIRGSSPQARFSEHARSYPSDWRPTAHKGPPPARAWDRPGKEYRRDLGDRRGDDDRRQRTAKRVADERRDLAEKRARVVKQEHDERKGAAGKKAGDARKNADDPRGKKDTKDGDGKHEKDEKDEKKDPDEKRGNDG